MARKLGVHKFLHVQIVVLHFLLLGAIDPSVWSGSRLHHAFLFGFNQLITL